MMQKKQLKKVGGITFLTSLLAYGQGGDFCTLNKSANLTENNPPSTVHPSLTSFMLHHRFLDVSACILPWHGLTLLSRRC